jgi:hypothetical protein
MLLRRKSGQSFPAYGYLNWRVLEGEVRYYYGTLPPLVPVFI